MTEETYYPVCIRSGGGQHHNDFYQYLGEDRWKNLRTGVEGHAPPESASKVFTIDLSASEIINKNPLVADLIRIGFKNSKP